MRFTLTKSLLIGLFLSVLWGGVARADSYLPSNVRQFNNGTQPAYQCLGVAGGCNKDPVTFLGIAVNNGGLDARKTVLTFYFTDLASFRAGVYDGRMKSSTPDRCLSSGCTDTEVFYDFYALDANGNRNGSSYRQLGTTLAIDAWTDLGFNGLFSNPPSPNPNYGNLLGVEMEVTFRDETGPKQNGFQVRATGNASNSVEYAENGFDAAKPYVIQHRPSSDDFVAEDKYNFYFGAYCSVPAGGEVRRVQWKDADWNGTEEGIPPNPANIAMTLFDETDGSTWSMSGAGMGGQDEVRTMDFIAKPGHKYRWEWYNVNHMNGIQMWMPFDGVKYRFAACEQPHSVQGYRSIGPASAGTVFPNGVGSTYRDGAGTTANPYFFTNNLAAHTYTSEATIAYSGGIYGRHGYTVCADISTCHDDPPNTADTVVLGPKSGGFYELWWHYNRLPDSSSMSATCTTLSITLDDAENDAFDLRLIVDGVDTTSEQFNLTDGTHTFDITGWRDFAGHNFSVRVIDRNTSGESRVIGSVSPGICAAVSCGSMQLSPPDPESGMGFTVGYSFNIVDTAGNPIALGANATGSGYAATLIAATPPALVLNNTGPMAPAPPSDGTASAGDISILVERGGVSASSTGNYEATVRLAGLNPNPLNCQIGGPNPPIPVRDKPYFRVYGGDVAAGSAFSTGLSCTPASFDKSIIAWNKWANSGVDAAGAGTQLLAFATDPILDFVSAQLRGSWPLPPKGLSFANSVGGTYGGDLSNAPGCIDDYFSRAPFDITDDPALLNGAVGRRSLRDGLVLNNNNPFGGGIAPGQRLTIYVNGNVNIDGDITYPTSYNSLDEVPMLRIVARKIYISPSVNKIDAILVAQPSGSSDGIIYTCSNGAFEPPTVGSIADSSGACRNSKLTINGALIARKIELLRSVGTLNNSSVGEGNGSSNIAEVINFTPDFWIVNPIDDSVSPGVPEYNDFTGLPPSL